MFNRYKSNHSNEVHQLLVSVSKHYFVGAKNKIRYQKKEMDVSLKNFGKSEREHLVFYILRDHFSSFFYVEIASTKKLIDLRDFLLRAFLPKPDIEFRGLPTALMIPKQVEEIFGRMDDFFEALNIQKLYPSSGFASGMIAVKNWEKLMKIPLLPDELSSDITLWNPRTAAHYLKVYRDEQLDKWLIGLPKINGKRAVLVINEEVARSLGSESFKLSSEFTLYKTR